MWPRSRPMPEKPLALLVKDFPLLRSEQQWCQIQRAFSTSTAQKWRTSLPTIYQKRKHLFSLPHRSHLLRQFLESHLTLQHGNRSRPGMSFQLKTRPSIQTWSDSWQSEWELKLRKSKPAMSASSPTRQRLQGSLNPQPLQSADKKAKHI